MVMTQDHRCVLFLAAPAIPSVRDAHYCYSLHHACCGVAQEFTSWLDRAINSYVMLGGHVEIARFRWVMRGLF